MMEGTKRQGTEALVNLAARRSIILPAFSPYGELGGFYDYGPIGIRIRHNIESTWRRHFIEAMGNVEVDTTIIGPEIVFQASGHLGNFSDPITVCSKCKTSYRVDKLLEELFQGKGDKKSVDRVKTSRLPELEQMMVDNGVKCEKCGTPLKKADTFNLMLGTSIGPMGGTSGYLRPETAQGIFIDFKNIFRNLGLKLPVGIGQIGKAFRNEISPRRMLIRMREFSQMELEFFFDPEEKELIINGENVGDGFLNQRVNFVTREMQLENSGKDFIEITLDEGLKNGYIPNKLFAYLMFRAGEFMDRLGFPTDSFRFRQQLEHELPHYSKGNIDVEARHDDGFEELIGIAYRTDYDLSNHAKFSKSDMSVVNGEKKLVPHVVEISFGLDRIFWVLLSNSLRKDDKREWDLLLLNQDVAPYKYAVYPLQKDEGLVKKAQEILKGLNANGTYSYYSLSGSIGKRYAKSDETGIPFAITVDFTTLEDGTVTVRDARTGEQVRKSSSEIR
ncbi:MAG: glycine--tRNA ligase [Candidatus Micrarchaeota archaeon]|nr:glycine--tRNA ligase [Candidatus Micrarchaeota archaeon]